MSAQFTLARNKFSRLPVNIKSVIPKWKHDFICLDCGQQLTCVLNVPDLTKHFKHRSENCGVTNETLLHLTAKEIIANSNYLILPDASKFEIKESSVEKKVDNYRPDVILKNGFESLYVEVVVTNSICSNKEQWLEQNNRRCLIIDLSTYPLQFDMGKFRFDIIDSINYKSFNQLGHLNKNVSDDSGVKFLIGTLALGIGYLLFNGFFSHRLKKKYK